MIIRGFSDWPTWELKSPFDELERMRRELDRLSGDFTGSVLRLTLPKVEAATPRKIAVKAV
jgi:hypothetical protein